MCKATKTEATSIVNRSDTAKFNEGTLRVVFGRQTK